MTHVKVLVNKFGYKVGEISDIPNAWLEREWKPEWYEVIQGESPKAKSKVATPPPNDEGQAGKTMHISEVEGAKGLIIEEGVNYKIQLLDDEVVEYSYDTEDGRVFKRYELSVAHDGEETKVRLPPTLVADMYKQAAESGNVPISSHHPSFTIRKKGQGIKTKWTAIIQGE